MRGRGAGMHRRCSSSCVTEQTPQRAQHGSLPRYAWDGTCKLHRLQTPLGGLVVAEFAAWER